MNNKGFAVSTILYGLSIMGFLIVLVLIGLMASNRSNTREFVKQVEDELNRYGAKQTVITPYANNPNYPQEYFTIDGNNEYWYKIELWNGNTYKSATFRISPNTIIYFYIGDGTYPTIACLDGDSRENCNMDGEKLIMTTEGAGDGINTRDSVSQKTDEEASPTAVDPSTRIVELHGTHGAKNVYQYTSVNDNKVRISLASMDSDGGFNDNIYSSIPTVFYLGGNGNVYTCTCSSSSCFTKTAFTGDQDQQWTVAGGEAYNVKYRDCKAPNLPGTYHNALF